ncbi:BrnT family toxin [Azospirillum sp.]|nr:BrnT family toxin [Azospirillum sp.]HYD65663.1 BrnT family toxin [Azospirillum sp.]
MDGHVLAVVYTWRGDACRIISARMANRHERRAYRETVAGLAPDEED